MGRANVESFVRLYMLPGVQHCGGGPGPDTFGQSADWPDQDPQHNVRIALENWVEKGTAPTTFIASKMGTGAAESTPVMTRPLCPYPQAAQYKGTGDPNSADNFVCMNPKK
jgi:feruloyl esterase